MIYEAWFRSNPVAPLGQDKSDPFYDAQVQSWIVSSSETETLTAWQRQEDALKPKRVFEDVADLIVEWKLLWISLSGFAISLLNYLIVGSFRLKPWRSVGVARE